MTILDAAHALRSYPVFAKTSLRHLTDLVELALPDQQVLGFDDTVRVDAAFILVLGGRVRVAPAFLLNHTDVLWLPLAVAAQAMFAADRPRTIAGPVAGVAFHAGVNVIGAAAQRTAVLPLKHTLLVDAARASTSFGRSVDLRPLGFEMSLYDFFVAHGTA